MNADALPGAVPRTAFGLVAEALHRRRERGIAARMFTAFARMRSPELADWIEHNVAFPNSMVDRITPVTTDHDRETLAERFGVQDASPVVCEPFAQWVLEDHFPAGRPRSSGPGCNSSRT